MIWAPCETSLAAHAFALAGLFPCVLQGMSLILKGPFVLLIWAIRVFAVARAGPSKGAMFPTPSYAQPIVIVFACGAADPTATTVIATAATAASASAAFPTLSISFLLSVSWYLPTSNARLSPRGLLPSHETVDQRVQGHPHVVPIRLPEQRARDELDLRLPAGVHVLEHRRVVRRAAPCREDVHLPRIVVEPDPGSRRDGLALVHEAVDEVPEVSRLLLLREVGVVAEPGQGGDGIDGGVEDELRPLRRTEIGERLGAEAGRDERVGDVPDDRHRCPLVRAEPRLRVEDVLNVGVR